MKNLKGKVSVIIPAYNEAGSIAENIEETVRVFDEFGCKYEIIVVDDGSRDDTYNQALKAAGQRAVVGLPIAQEGPLPDRPGWASYSPSHRTARQYNSKTDQA